jgi:hypothetical protein
MKSWHRILLPANWKHESVGTKVSGMHIEYKTYFDDHNIEWKFGDINWSSNYMEYKIYTEGEEDITVLKLRLGI